MTRNTRLAALFIAVTTFAAAVTTPAAFAAPDPVVQGCLHAADGPAGSRDRRQAAIRYVRAIKATQDRMRIQRRTYVPLVEAEATTEAKAPFGFVPRLTFDQWGYVLILKDVLDPCGFSLFANQDAAVYIGQPINEGEAAQVAP